MISIANITAIAKYERVTLLRSWFFKIFALLSILVIGFFMLAVLVVPSWSMDSWLVRAIPSNIPYLSILLLNVVQAIVAIFLASDFLKQDSKLDTTDVIYVRSMSNIDYVLGKTIGNMGVFLWLNIIILAITLVLNLASPNADVDLLSYAYYFFLISVPTLTFIMGLTFLLMSLIKNQAITFVVLLGYIAISLFYLRAKFYYVFDYMAYSIPMSKSDFVGFGNLDVLLNHRGMYFCFGLAFISFTIMLLRRLSHSKTERMVSAITGFVFLFAALYMGYNHVTRVQNGFGLRKEMIAINDQFEDVDRLMVKDYNIDLTHQGDEIQVVANLSIQNRNAHMLDTLVFSLNPGLQLDSLLLDNKPASFTQKAGLVWIENAAFAPRKRADVRFVYHGHINEAAAYLDVDDEQIEELNTQFLYQFDKRYAFLTKQYVLLTRENIWYPVPGTGFGIESKQWLTAQFSNYELSVHTDPNLTVISQGISTTDSLGTTKYESSHANDEISLVIGKYDSMSTQIDGLDFKLYYYPGHDYFRSFFDTIQDTIPSIILESLEDYERSIDAYYPFERFTMVETPVQYFAYDRVFSSGTEFVQPEIALVPEKGVHLSRKDFEQSYERLSSGGDRGRGGGRGNQQLSDEEKRIMILRDFVASFLESSGRPDFSNNAGEFTVSETSNKYYLFPMFYDHANVISSDEWPISNRVFAAYKASAVSSDMNPWMRNMQGMTGEEKANLALLSESFEDLLNDPEEKDIIADVVELKGTMLFSVIKQKVGDDEFDDFLYDYMYRNRFKTVTIEQFSRSLKNKFGVDLIDYMEEWFKSKKLPAYLFSDIEAVNVLDGDELKTMVQFKVSNVEGTEGVIEVEFRSGGGPRRGATQDNITKFIHLEGNQTKDVSMLISGSPRGGTVSTFTSKNVPSQIDLNWGKLEEDQTRAPYEGETVVDDPVRVVEPYEIVVDNEDKGFKITQVDKTSRLRKWLLSSQVKEDKYASFNQWRPPINWTLTTNSNFYGANIRSAYYTAAGSGDQMAEWSIPLRGEGYYDVYVYLYKERRNRNHDEYHYTLNTQEGEEKVLVDVRNAEIGWYHMGAFYFEGDTTVVHLSNENKGKMVVADAVKFVKQNN